MFFIDGRRHPFLFGGRGTGAFNRQRDNLFWADANEIITHHPTFKISYVMQPLLDPVSSRDGTRPQCSQARWSIGLGPNWGVAALSLRLCSTIERNDNTPVNSSRSRIISMWPFPIDQNLIMAKRRSLKSWSSLGYELASSSLGKILAAA